jgi:hypothetical protein
VALEDPEVDARGLQVMPQGEAGLACSDHEDIDGLTATFFFHTSMDTTPGYPRNSSDPRRDDAPRKV